jgi:hypothetical protein
MQLIAHQELTSAASSITFSSIPQTFTDLYLKISARTNRASTQDDFILLKPNNSTSNLTNRRLYGQGSTVFSFSGTVIYGGAASTTSQTANTFGSCAVYIPNYTSTANKSFSTDFVNENNATSAVAGIAAGLWSDSSAITSLVLAPETGTQFEIGTSMTLYGILAGTDGIVSVS